MHTITAKGILRHHFWGTYVAGIALQFLTEQDASDALALLNKDDPNEARQGDYWAHGKEHREILVWHGGSEAVEFLKKDLKSKGEIKMVPCSWSHCKDHCQGAQIDGLPHSVDVGPAFELSLRVSAVSKDQLNLFG